MASAPFSAPSSTTTRHARGTPRQSATSAAAAFSEPPVVHGTPNQTAHLGPQNNLTRRQLRAQARERTRCQQVVDNDDAVPALDAVRHHLKRVLERQCTGNDSTHAHIHQRRARVPHPPQHCWHDVNCSGTPRVERLPTYRAVFLLVLDDALLTRQLACFPDRRKPAAEFDGEQRTEEETARVLGRATPPTGVNSLRLAHTASKDDASLLRPPPPQSAPHQSNDDIDDAILVPNELRHTLYHCVHVVRVFKEREDVL